MNKRTNKRTQLNQHGLWSWLRISTLCSIYRAYLTHLNNHSINRRIQLAQFAYAYFSVLQLKLVSQLSILDENRIWPIHRVTAIQTIVRLFVKLLVLQLNLLYGSFFYIFIFMFTKLHQNPTTKLYCRHKNNHSNWRSLYEDQFWF